ncbi:hypothetical protein Fmac_002891 [Flemingia macrophylla]|uniref:BZIP transcription factor n=1 Tax=Flemingia macrophylla TaxID=520843 RepID=A0ABD1NLD3_9FABA
MCPLAIYRLTQQPMHMMHAHTSFIISAYNPPYRGPNTPHTVVNQTMSIIPMSAGGAHGAVPGPTTNLNIGMDYWGTPASSNIPALSTKVPSTAVAGGMVTTVGSWDSAQSQLWLQDGLIYSAKRDKLTQRAEALKEENASLRSEISMLSSLQERLGEQPTNDDHRSGRTDQHADSDT